MTDPALGVRIGPPEPVNDLDAARQREQPSDAHGRMFGPAERRHEREQAKRKRGQRESKALRHQSEARIYR